LNSGKSHDKYANFKEFSSPMASFHDQFLKSENPADRSIAIFSQEPDFGMSYKESFKDSYKQSHFMGGQKQSFYNPTGGDYRKPDSGFYTD